MKGDIKLSPQHGVNPSIGVCFYCGEDSGEIILPGRLKGDVEAPRRAVWTREPCPTCKGWMAQGVIFISVRLGGDEENPYRTGGFVVLKDEAVRRAVRPPAFADQILKARVAFVPNDVWKALGLPALPGGAS